MKLLHRHIFANVALTSLAALAVLCFVLILGNVLKELLGFVLAGQLGFDLFLRMIWLLVPYVISHALPMAVLTGVLLVLGRMSADREITAIRSAGVSIAGISAPIFFLAILGVVLSATYNFYFMPKARLAFKQEKADIVRTSPLSFLQVPKTFIRVFPGVILYISEIKGETLQDFWIWKLDKQNRVTLFARAQSATIKYDQANKKLVATLSYARVEQRDPKDPEDFSVLRAAASMDRLPIDFEISGMMGGKDLKVDLDWMTLPQLLSRLHNLDHSDSERIKVQAVIQEKAAKAFSVLSFALIAIPLGIKVSRKETSANLGVALALVMAYYVATFAVGSLGNKPEFRPDLLMWLPNLGFQVLGIRMFYKADRG